MKKALGPAIWARPGRAGGRGPMAIALLIKLFRVLRTHCLLQFCAVDTIIVPFYRGGTEVWQG